MAKVNKIVHDFIGTFIDFWEWIDKHPTTSDMYNDIEANKYLNHLQSLYNQMSVDNYNELIKEAEFSFDILTHFDDYPSAEDALNECLCLIDCLFRHNMDVSDWWYDDFRFSYDIDDIDDEFPYVSE